jgi:hypothetical protein
LVTAWKALKMQILRCAQEDKLWGEL